MSTRNRSQPNAGSGRPVAALEPEKILLLGTVAGWLLLAVLLLMAVRLTWSEELFSSIQERVFAASDAAVQTLPPGPGLATIIASAVIMLAIAGAIAWTQRLSRAHFIWLGAVLILGPCAGAAEIHAPNKLLALAGTCDFLTALLAGWSIFVLLQHERLRPLVVAAAIAVLAAWTVRTAQQRFVDIPDTIAYFKQYRDTILAQHHWKPDDFQARLFEARALSGEIGGFFTLSNVLAAGQEALLLLGVGLLVQSIRAAKENADPERPAGEVSLPVLIAALLGAVMLAGLGIFAFTKSKGGAGTFAAAAIVLLAGLLAPAWFARHRRTLVRVMWTGLALFFGAALALGLLHHGLPTRSLLFRWHYWTGAIPMIEAHPLGVGMNNFGAYYSQYKLPISPEYPKDPHNFFIRIAAEAGIPAAIAAFLLIVWAFHRALRPVDRSPEQLSAPAPAPALAEALGIGAAFCALWFFIRLPLAERLDSAYAIYMNAIYFVLALCGFYLAVAAYRFFTRKLAAPMLLAALAGAGAMLLYDQINMAAVTGAVAMLFWVLLAFGQPQPPRQVARPGDAAARRSRRVGRIIAFPLIVASGALFWLASVPLALGEHPWDVTPLELQMTQAESAGDWAKALSLADRALAVDGRAEDLLHARIEIRQRLHEPIAADIRALLAEQPFNAQLRLSLGKLAAGGPCDWPVSEQIASLETAVKINDGLAWLDTPTRRDPMRLSDSQLNEIQKLLAQLRAGQQRN